MRRSIGLVLLLPALVLGAPAAAFATTLVGNDGSVISTPYSSWQSNGAFQPTNGFPYSVLHTGFANSLYVYVDTNTWFNNWIDLGMYDPAESGNPLIATCGLYAQVPGWNHCNLSTSISQGQTTPANIGVRQGNPITMALHVDPSSPSVYSLTDQSYTTGTWSCWWMPLDWGNCGSNTDNAPIGNMPFYASDQYPTSAPTPSGSFWTAANVGAPGLSPVGGYTSHGYVPQGQLMVSNYNTSGSSYFAVNHFGIWLNGDTKATYINMALYTHESLGPTDMEQAHSLAAQCDNLQVGGINGNVAAGFYYCGFTPTVYITPGEDWWIGAMVSPLDTTPGAQLSVEMVANQGDCTDNEIQYWNSSWGNEPPLVWPNTAACQYWGPVGFSAYYG
ncbi:MAG: hypothetical protein JO318_05035 [Chloroflexi bacterium]|nr:hypothetical protein [Chloroflexota bacterium]